MTITKVGINGTEGMKMFEPLIEECKLRNYSPKTIKNYLYYNQKFINFCRKKPQEVCRSDVRQYLLYLESKRASSSQINLAHNALNFYYVKIMKRKFTDLPYQKREDTVKEILSQEEIKRLIDVTENVKHKLMISLLYATGIRVSELVKIKLEHFDFGRRRLLVKQGKGNKDRYTILSDKVMGMIEEYVKSKYYQNGYLFGSYSNSHISVRTVQEVLKQAATKARISKTVTPHILRHSFATHLLDHKVEFPVIQKLLGHKNIKTTQQYARVSNVHLHNVVSPHDNLY
ncbi:MAG: tyrosine-type recombinase/integrase [Nanoarchaeota archaeon]|nr:tyrosine-type recombinase/integrase [Nanoarchaeota archaeon]